jgi:hypothetical protein
LPSSSWSWPSSSIEGVPDGFPTAVVHRVGRLGYRHPPEGWVSSLCSQDGLEAGPPAPAAFSPRMVPGSPYTGRDPVSTWEVGRTKAHVKSSGGPRLGCAWATGLWRRLGILSANWYERSGSLLASTLGCSRSAAVEQSLMSQWPVAVGPIEHCEMPHPLGGCQGRCKTRPGNRLRADDMHLFESQSAASRSSGANLYRARPSFLR